MEQKKWLLLADSVVAILFFAPLTVFFWRGVWQLLDIYLLPDDAGLTALVSCVIGYAILLLLTVTQYHLDADVTPDRPAFYYVATLVYTLVYAFGSVNQWRGVWLGLDYLLGISWQNVAALTLVGWLCLCLLRCSKYIFAPPLVIGIDGLPGHFAGHTRLYAKPSNWGIFLLDCAITRLLVDTLVVFVWRGVWTLMDVYLAPDSPTLTAWASLIIGVGIYSLCCVLQPIAAFVSKRLDLRLLLKLIVEDLFYAAANFGAINMWRGPWLLCNLYILPQDMYAASNALTAAVGVVLMLLTRTCSSLPGRGYPLDGSLVDGEGAWLPNEYFRVLLHRETPNELDLASPMPYGGKCNDIKLISITKLMDDVAGQSESAQ